jgi:hypothetical protein
MLVNNRPELNIAHAMDIQTTTPTTFASMTIYISYIYISSYTDRALYTMSRLVISIVNGHSMELLPHSNIE